MVILPNGLPGAGKITGGIDKIKRFVHPKNTDPATEFEARMRKICPEGIPQLLVEGNGRLILCGDQGINALVTLKDEDFFQRKAEFFADAAALGFRQQIHRIFCAPTVGIPVEGCRTVGIT